MTAIIAISHAFRRNPDFNPTLLYLAAFFLDAAIIEGTILT